MTEILEEYRKRRGREIADKGGIVRRNNKLTVPSETKATRKYSVEISPTNVSCTCPDHKKIGERCKHIYAAEIFLRREQGLDETDAPVGPRRPTYPRDFSLINAAQTREEDEFEPMLFALCQGVADFPYAKGRRPVPLCDVIFAIITKVYLGKSARRVVSRLNRSHRDGYLSRPIPFGTLLDYLERDEIAPILEEMIVRSSLPMVPIETVFAIDSTGMSGSRFVRWRDIKYRGIKEKLWAKLHVMIGTRTMIVTAAYIGDRDASDTVQLPRLLNTTARSFTIRELVADIAYNTKDNQKRIADIGARAFIPYKSNHVGKGGGVWTEQFQWAKNNAEEFDKHYHQRSKIESAFMSMKTVFGDSLRSRKPTAMKNEALCKLICHNLVCLNRAMDQFGIGAEFLTATLEAAE
ncbi:MAG TPA: transposase [Stellaceae bacterium]|nr:transposase [Stellaceae bacterium]